MSVLIVEVVDTESQLRQEYTFDRGPIRIGRSPLNELPLERPFVSHCHGVLQYDALRCEFVDLGSTNGTFVGGERLVKNQPTTLSAHSVLRIGALELRVRRGTSAKVETRASYAFRPSDLNVVAVAASARSAPPPAVVVPCVPPSEPAARSERMAALYVQYRAGGRAFFDALTAAVPTAVDREAVAADLLGRFPELAQETEFRRWWGTDRGAMSTSSPPPAEPEAGLGAALGLRLSPDGVVVFRERVGQLLERFALAFLELRRGHRQFARELSLRSATDDALDEIEDGRALLLHLLDPAAPAGRVDELSRAYADLMLHQVALLNGVMAGARELLAALSPTGLATGHAGGLLGWLGRVFGRDARWRRFRRRFGDLEEERALASVVLGGAFARAYAAAMGQTSAHPDPSRRVGVTGPL